MHEMVESAYKEPGTLSYEWALAEFGDLPSELRDAVAGLSPIYMTPIGGFVR